MIAPVTLALPVLPTAIPPETSVLDSPRTQVPMFIEAESFANSPTLTLDVVSAADKTSALTGITLSKGAYTAALSDVTGTIASGTVVTSVTDATVPVLATVSATGSISGSVATTLTTSNYTVAELSSTSINIGTWALGESNSDVSGAIAVGKAGNAKVSGSITIVSGTYVTDVTPKKLS